MRGLRPSTLGILVLSGILAGCEESTLERGRTELGPYLLNVPTGNIAVTPRSPFFPGLAPKGSINSVALNFDVSTIQDCVPDFQARLTTRAMNEERLRVRLSYVPNDVVLAGEVNRFPQGLWEGSGSYENRRVTQISDGSFFRIAFLGEANPKNWIVVRDDPRETSSAFSEQDSYLGSCYQGKGDTACTTTTLISDINLYVTLRVAEANLILRDEIASCIGSQVSSWIED